MCSLHKSTKAATLVRLVQVAALGLAPLDIPRDDRSYRTTSRGRTEVSVLDPHPTYVPWVLARVREDNPVLGAILGSKSSALDGQDTIKAVFAPHRTVSMHTRHCSSDLRQSPRKPLGLIEVPGVRIPLSA